MPGVVRTAAVSSLVVSGAYGRVSAHFTWLSPIAGSALSSNDLVNASWCVSALHFRLLWQVMLTVPEGHLRKESSLLPSVFARLPLLPPSRALIQSDRLV